MEATMNRHQEETKAQMASLISKMDAHHARMMACLEKTVATDLETNPEETQSGGDDQEVPREDAAVEAGRGLNKQHRDRHLAAGRRCQLEERTWKNCGFHKKLGTTHIKMTHCAGVVWCKGNIIGENRTRDKMVQEPQKDRSLGRDISQIWNAKSGIKD